MRPSACSPWTMPERAFASLPLDQVVQQPRFVHVLGDVRRERRRHLPVPRQVEREADLLDRLGDTLRLRHELGLAQPARRLRRLDEPLRVLGAHVVVDVEADRLGAELRDRVARVDALRAALIAEVATRAVPDPVLPVHRVEPPDLVVVARVADEAEALGERRRARELRVRLHRVALGDAAAAHDAERLLVDHVHLLLGDDALLLRRLVVARVEPGLDRADLVPERIHVHDEVLEHRHVPHRRDHGHVARVGDRLHALLAGEDGAAVHAHPAGAADHHPAALAVGERAVVLVLDQVEHVEQAGPLGRVHLVLAQGLLARFRVEPPDLERYVRVSPLVVSASSGSRSPLPPAAR